MAKQQYDAMVIGSGTAGQTAAHELASSGLTVALVEYDDRPGGTCALSGCQAKKWFYEGTEVIARSKHMVDRGVTAPASVSWPELLRQKNAFTAKVPDNTVEGLKKAGIDVIRGQARFTAARAIAVDQAVFEPRYTVIATGARPMPLPMDGERWITTSRQFMELEQLPGRIVFVGGGFISFEFAHFAARLGPKGVQCTILEADSRPLLPFDAQMVQLLTAASESDRIAVHCNTAIAAVEKTGDQFSVITEDGTRFQADLVVHGAGRAPDIDALNLEAAGIEHAPGGISVDATMATSNPRVYAAGDCADTIQLARVADAEAQVAAANIMRSHRNSGSLSRMDYSAVPAVLFTYPQYAMVGATESALQDDGVPYTRSFDDQLGWPTYQRVGMRSAAYKILAGRDDEILGAHILSDSATGLIGLLTLAMVNGLSVRDLYRQCVMTPYPSRESDLLYMLKPLIG
jgi:glutathione reductase (NADPH)